MVNRSSSFRHLRLWQTGISEFEPTSALYGQCYTALIANGTLLKPEYWQGYTGSSRAKCPNF